MHNKKSFDIRKQNKKIKFKRKRISRYLWISLILLFSVGLVTSIGSGVLSFQSPKTTSETITLASYEHHGEFSYTAPVKENDIYDSEYITENEGVLFNALVDMINMTFQYDVSGSHKMTMHGTYEVSASIITTNWEKSYTLISTTPFSIINKTQGFTVDFSLNHSFYEQVVSTIDDQINIHSKDPYLLITCSIGSTGSIVNHSFFSEFSPKISIGLSSSIIDISENLRQTKQEHITTTQTVKTDTTSENQPVLWIPSTTVFGMLLLGTLLFTKNDFSEYSKDKKELMKTHKKYNEWIIETSVSPKLNDVTVTVKSIEDMIKISENLGKPLFHYTHDNQHVYSIIDDTSQYMYTLFGP